MQRKSSKTSFDFNDSISDHQRTSATRIEDPNFPAVTMDSFLLSPEKKMAKNDIIYLSKSEIEKELHEFIGTISHSKALNQNEITDYLSHLKNMVIGLIKENTRLSNFAESYHASRSELGSPVRGEDLHRRLIDLEGDRIKYEEKLEVHGAYITELEDKINQMIREYIKVLEKNEDLSKELQIALGGHNLPAGTTFRSLAAPTLDKLGSLIENEQNLYDENSKIKGELAAMKQRMTQMETKKSPRLQVNGKEVDDVESLKEENKRLLQKMQEQEEALKNAQNQNGELQRENKLLKQNLSGLEEKFTSHCSQYLVQIEQLNDELQQADYQFQLLNNKCEHLEKLSKTRSEMESLLKLRAEIIQDLEEKLENLASENNELVKISDENSIMVLNLKSQLDQSHNHIQRKHIKSNSNLSVDEKSNQARAAQQQQEKKQEKAHSLAFLNSELKKELENLKADLANNQKNALNITKEMKKCLDNYKECDSKLAPRLSRLAVNNQQEFVILAELYEKARKNITQVSELVEEKRKFV